MKRIKLLCVAFFCIYSFFVFAQKSRNHDGNSVTLVVYGTADNKDAAIKTALRSAIEQTFGTFVSANTQIVNDELVKDEIVSVSSGNIENYSIISSDMQSDGKCSVSIKATVSIGKLIQYAQSKGATTELAGATFAMNMKMRRLNKENEYQAICHMLDKMIKMCEQNLFDYEIKTGEPQVVNGYEYLYGIPITISIMPNKNYNYLIKEFESTIESLSLSKLEEEDFKKSNDKTYRYNGGYMIDRDYNNYKDYRNFDVKGFKTEYRQYTKYNDYFKKIYQIIKGFPPFILRNNINESKEIQNKLEKLRNNIWKSSMSFRISDNMGNSSMPIIVYHKDSYRQNKDLGCDWPIYCEKMNSQYVIYGIKNSESSKNKSFMGSSIGSLKPSYRDGNITIKKEMYVDESLYTHKNYDAIYLGLYTGWRLSDKEINCEIGYNYFFNRFHGRDIVEQSCLDLAGKIYPFLFYLFYNENDISSLNSINISPVSPNEIITKTVE